MRKPVLSGEGPGLEELTRLLLEAGDEWLDPGLDIGALASDALEAMGGAFPDGEGIGSLAAARKGEDAAAALRRKAMSSLVLRVLSCPRFRGRKEFVPAAEALLSGKDIAELSAAADPESFRSDPERREELSRLCLAALGLRPAGEGEAAAADRLNAVDSIERRRLMELSRKAQERSRELREAMARAQAQEAASKMARE